MGDELSDLWPYGFVSFHTDGTWSPLPERDGGLQAAIEPVLEYGEIVDAVAWPMFNGRRWGLRIGAAVVLGFDDIEAAIRQKCPLVLVENPRQWVMSRGCPLAIACVLDWSADLFWIFDQVRKVRCVSNRLERRFRNAITRRRAPCLIEVI